MLPPIAFFGQTWGGERLGDLFPRVVPVYCQHAALLRNFPLPQLSAFESDNAAAVRLCRQTTGRRGSSRPMADRREAQPGILKSISAFRVI